MASSNILMVPSVSSMSIKNDNLKTYFPLWINSLLSANENRNTQRKLRLAIDRIRMFENSIECEIYIRQSKDDQILLITSGQLGHHELQSKFTKTRPTIMDSNRFVEKIQVNRERKERLCNEPLLISIFSSISNKEYSSTNINGGFLHFQLFIDGLLRFPDSQTSRNEFFNLWEKEYKDNDQQLFKLKEFKESYIPEKALYWYTGHKFLCEKLNKALRAQNINVLFLFRFFIQDLYKQLKKLQRQQDQIPIRVYRGQYISKQELQDLQESKGKIISMNSFLSTSLDREVSCIFIESERDDLCRVLFEIRIDPCVSYDTKPFANISLQSQFIDEQEVLFMIATIFRLVDIYQENEINIIQMELSNGNYDYDTKRLFEHMQKESEEYDERLSLGHILRAAGLYHSAEQFYNRVLNELPDDHPLIADIWSSIGLLKKEQGGIEFSSKWFNASMKKYEQIEDHPLIADIWSSIGFLKKEQGEIEFISKWFNASLKKYEQTGNHLGLAKCLQSLALIHLMKREFDQAIDKCSQALNTFQEVFGGQKNKWVVMCLHNLGVIYFKQDKFIEAAHYYTTVLDIRRTILPHGHPDIAATINNIGNVCFENGEFAQALQYYERALDIFKMSLPSEHPSVASTYYNMVLAYLKKKDYERSLIFLNRATYIYQNTLPSDHPDVRRCLNTIDYIKQRQSQFK
ncbi:unnamed protein product [Adineta steineri]|uniref:NAD(P)(+)--arginine ADP-ribosyltransferase n=1 Tax=Adineta steineri TaxID=433720 RepID=A0A813WFB4_9BILA|nr:unnamed protein product [Adineta steineri]CAF1273857.1 unnamed protein product [Adineta steineri]